MFRKSPVELLWSYNILFLTAFLSLGSLYSFRSRFFHLSKSPEQILGPLYSFRVAFLSLIKEPGTNIRAIIFVPGCFTFNYIEPGTNITAIIFVPGCFTFILRPYTRGYQKVRRLMRLNQYLWSYAYKFCRGYKTTNVLSVVKIFTFRKRHILRLRRLVIPLLTKTLISIYSYLLCNLWIWCLRNVKIFIDVS